MSAISAEPNYACFSTHSLQEGFRTLSIEQKYAFAKFARGQNLFITGPGGTGKTRLIQFMVEYMNSLGKTHQVCALTGCAATLLNCKAKTIHSWSGVRLAKGNPEDIIRRVIRNKTHTKSWRGVEVLIVDEVSMMSRKMFDLLDQIGRATRKINTKPFGGVQLVFTGDFFQLPPIPDQDDPTSGEFCFQHPKWEKTFKPEDCIELKTFFRQTDPAYISILQEVRRGTISAPNIELLQTRLMRGRPTEMRNGVLPTKLFPVRAKVETINETSYTKLEGEERVYQYSVTTKAKIRIDNGATLSSAELAHCEELTSDQLSAEIDNLITSLFTEKTVRLKIGTLVMCTANIDVDRGICNGSQGVVVGYAESNAAILPDELMRKMSGAPAFVPVVQFANGVTMKVAPHQRQSEEYPCIIVSQIPLCLAWALTIHKIQGATLDMAEMDIGRSIFAAGQSYVALSRVKTLDGLYLSEFNSTKIKANPLVIEFYNSFPQIGEDEILQNIPVQMGEINILREPAKTESKMKQSTMKLFAPSAPVVSAPVGQNPFAAFNHIPELREEDVVATTRDPTIKTIKLSKY
jgi:ATP-dependent DNA helicase PIF1